MGGQTQVSVSQYWLISGGGGGEVRIFKFMKLFLGARAAAALSRAG